MKDERQRGQWENTRATCLCKVAVAPSPDCMGQVCSGSAGEEAAVSCPRSDAKRPGAAPKALGVCFSDFFGVGNLLGCRLHRGPEARTDRRGWTGTGELRAALGTIGSRTWAEFPRGEVVGCAHNISGPASLSADTGSSD